MTSAALRLLINYLLLLLPDLVSGGNKLTVVQGG